jgi:chromosome partitioning protein
MRTHATLVINSKGGSGKTTVATNLASYFAARNVPTAIMDYDPQGSSLGWVQARPRGLGKIHAANAAPQKSGLRSIGMHVPAGVRQLVIDAPAGASGLLLQELLARAHAVLVPVQPSTIDIRATANFVRDLLLSGRLRARNVRLAVVANRVRRSTPVYQPLERFLASLGLPLLGRLADSEKFVEAGETGVGIFEMDAAEEQAQFMPIVEWVDPETRTESKVIELTSPRFFPMRA